VIGLRLLAGLSAFALAIGGLGLLDLSTALLPDPDGGDNRVLAAGYGATVGLLLPVGLLARGGPASRPLTALAAAAAAPWLAYGWRMAANQRAGLPPADAETAGLHHWTAAAALAGAVVLVALLAALRTRGWRVPAWSAAAAAACGSASWMDPDVLASHSRAWGRSRSRGASPSRRRRSGRRGAAPADTGPHGVCRHALACYGLGTLAAWKIHHPASRTRPT
jgi:hypothetical protein